jgi:hypothetical protein
MKVKCMTAQELIEALQRCQPDAEVYVHAEMSLLVECPVTGIVHRTETGEQWQAVLQIEEVDEEELLAVEN